MKKNIVILLFLVLLGSVSSTYASQVNVADVMPLLSELKIMVGDENGDYQRNAYENAYIPSYLYWCCVIPYTGIGACALCRVCGRVRNAACGFDRSDGAGDGL